VPILWRNHIVPFRGLINVLIEAPLLKRRDLNLTRQDVSTERWNRFVWFSQHVRRLVIRSWRRDRIASLLGLKELHSHFGGPLLPNLHSLEGVIIGTPHDYALPELVFSASLRSVEAWPDDRTHPLEGSFDQFLTIFQSQCPYIEKIELRGSAVLSFDSFHQFKHLKSFTKSGKWTPEAFISLLRCDQLQKLILNNFGVNGAVDDGLSDEAIQASGLLNASSGLMTIPRLEELKMTTWKYKQREDTFPGGYTPVWECVSCPSLRHLHIRPNARNSLRLMRHLHQESPLLDRITCQVVFEGVDSEFLSSIQTFQNIRHLSFFVGLGSNRRLLGLEITEFLSQLQELEVLEWIFPDHVHLRERDDLVDLEGLLRVKRNCCKLRQFSLPFRGSDLALDTRSISSDAQLFCLVESVQLIIFGFKRDDVESFARYMVHILPDSAVLDITFMPTMTHWTDEVDNGLFDLNKLMEAECQDLIKKLRKGESKR
ncbi:hypothetical protein FRC02_010286, partial [Tulasnella sp. 418]